MGDFDDLMEEEDEKLSRDEKYQLKVSRLSPQEFEIWKRNEIARGDAIKRKEAAEAGGAGAPELTDEERAMSRMDDAEFQERYLTPMRVPGFTGGNFQPTLSESSKLYRKKLGQ